ncbi:MAG: DNA-binding response regulator, partial [Propionibacteriaceae bacterium]|nr:DNA-binding response regulator [Propionibacteriaceae bacterium]
MALLLLVSNKSAKSAPKESVLPVLELLPHEVIVMPADTQALTESAKADLVILDGREDLTGARTMARLFHSSGSMVPLMLVATEGALATISAEWALSDFVVDTAGPA